MAYCAQCGVALAPGARYCASCGSAVAGPPLPPGAAPPPAPRKDTSTAETLITVGAVLAALLPILLAVAMLFLGSFFALFPPFGAIPAGIFTAVAVVFVVVGLLFGWAGVWARDLVRQGHLERGGMAAIVIGTVLAVLGNPIAGVIMLLGGIMAYTAR